VHRLPLTSRRAWIAQGEIAKKYGIGLPKPQRKSKILAVFLNQEEQRR